MLLCNNAYYLPSVEAVVNYLHSSAGFPVKSTWLKTIRAGNYTTWPGLDHDSDNKYFPQGDETIKGCMAQTHKSELSTNTNPMSTPKSPESNINLPPTWSHEIHVWIEHFSGIYTDQTGKFSVGARSANHYIMVMYHCDSNTILYQAFKNRTNGEIVNAYSVSMKRLNNNGHKFNLQVLDNEASQAYQATIRD